MIQHRKASWEKLGITFRGVRCRVSSQEEEDTKSQGTCDILRRINAREMRP